MEFYPECKSSNAVQLVFNTYTNYNCCLDNTVYIPAATPNYNCCLDNTVYISVKSFNFVGMKFCGLKILNMSVDTWIYGF